MAGGARNKKSKPERGVSESFDRIRDALAELFLLVAGLKQKYGAGVFAEDFEKITAELEKIRQALPVLESWGAGRTVLVIDDEEGLRQMLARTLSRAGYLVLTAADGKEALKIYSENERAIDLVLVDLLMPEMSGYSVIQALLRMNPAVKVIAMSGATGPAEQEAEEAGAVTFLQKPFEPDELLEVIRKVLDE